MSTLSRPRLPATLVTATMAVGRQDDGVAARGYLLWDEGFAPRYVAATALLAALAITAPPSRLLGPLQSLARRLEWWGALGLLSSSCCALQLLLNLASVGCAGFNTYLGPLRPWTLALVSVLQADAWRGALAGATAVSSAISGAVLCVALSLMPEALHLYTSSRGNCATGSTPGQLALSVSGMGCTACTLKVVAALEGVEGVASASVNLEEGRASLELTPPSGGAGTAARPRASEVERRAVAALVAAGFGGAPMAQSGRSSV
jgi:copper chaperone CopZ